MKQEQNKDRRDGSPNTSKDGNQGQGLENQSVTRPAPVEQPQRSKPHQPSNLEDLNITKPGVAEE